MRKFLQKPMPAVKRPRSSIGVDKSIRSLDHVRSGQIILNHKLFLSELLSPREGGVGLHDVKVTTPFIRRRSLGDRPFSVVYNDLSCYLEKFSNQYSVNDDQPCTAFDHPKQWVYK